ncbi:putative transcriptional regulator [Selenomonas ruminantium]|uniref:Putative transcriptional regulator n=1 Tax=Selenomonas ruminantium TaxID=971 RepID=A0A1I3H7V0_SELRU|nr:putative transcriptional regulator [Selenomonas ruminantium]
MTLKCNLRKLMYEHELKTFAEVIRLTGVNRNTITHLYHGHRLDKVQLGTYIKVCDGLQCSLDELLVYE